MAQQSVTVRFGLESVTRQMEAPVTIGNIRRDANLRNILGYGENCRALINGVAMSDDVVVPANCTVAMETAANTKAKVRRGARISRSRR